MGFLLNAASSEWSIGGCGIGFSFKLGQLGRSVWVEVESKPAIGKEQIPQRLKPRDDDGEMSELKLRPPKRMWPRFCGSRLQASTTRRERSATGDQRSGGKKPQERRLKACALGFVFTLAVEKVQPSISRRNQKSAKGAPHAAFACGILGSHRR
jgi:hypothetical protein